LNQQSKIATAAKNCGMAFDHMSIRLGDLWKMKHYFTAMEKSYLPIQEGLEELEDISG